jgi:putative transposase
LKEHEASVLVSDLCRKHGVSDASTYKWNAKGGLELLESRRLKTLEDEIAVEMAVGRRHNNAALKDLLGKNVYARSQVQAVAHLVGVRG